jgi:D-serine deaminase-like pyridoxal phosphate-dependent protein
MTTAPAPLLEAPRFLTTPALLIEKEVLLKNLQKAADVAKKSWTSLRPHMKTHKCREIAELQKKTGIGGITVATIDEAEAFFQAGFADIFVAYPMVGREKIQRFLRLHEIARMIGSVDHPAQIEDLLAASPSSPVQLRIEIDCGQHRCGVQADEKLLELAGVFAIHPEIKLHGVFTHPGHAYGAASSEALKQIALEESRAVLEAADMLRMNGQSCPVISIGSTPTLQFAGCVQGVTEIRPGNYVFHDAMQIALGAATTADCALHVLTTVISVFDDRFVIDAGSKVFGLDKGAHGLDQLKGFGCFVPEAPGWELQRLSEEHGVVHVAAGAPVPCVGDRLRFIPNHACAAANLVGAYWVIEKDQSPCRWELIGRRGS